MKLIHTSDWHLGRFLTGRSRAEEQRSFLNWLIDIMAEERADILLVAGDIFETPTPSNAAQQLYYNFLSLACTLCRLTVIIRGNHDSASLLSAPKELLKVLNVSVAGEPAENPEDSIIVLKDAPRAIICAFAYMADKTTILKHYSDVISLAEVKQKEILTEYGEKAPIIALAHLTVEGLSDDILGRYSALKEEAVELGELAARVDYFALGHIHSAFPVRAIPHLRYSGSPINMNPMKSSAGKKIVVAEFNGGLREIREIPVPVFQEIIVIEGSIQMVSDELKSLVSAGIKVWVLVKYSGTETYSEARETFNEIVKDSGVEVIDAERFSEPDISLDGETVDSRNPLRTFKRILEMKDVAEEDREELIAAFNEVLLSLNTLSPDTLLSDTL
ncbi:MAG: exonuclease subunit SbcD [Deferribacteraceae bacterium]|jgi:exonuclease SbcD|nr:exonuclease subunit SbcD [Deferribacteraceae bacterium]